MVRFDSGREGRPPVTWKAIAGAMPSSLALAGAQGLGLAAIGRGYPVRTDGRGNVYVFPRPPEGWDRAVVPVDVYSPDGERLFAGMMPSRSWLRARQEFVYGIELDASTDRQRIVRYRLVAPF